MEFLETHTDKDTKTVWKNDIGMPKDEVEKSSDESEDEEHDEFKETSLKTGEKKEEVYSSFLVFLLC